MSRNSSATLSFTPSLFGRTSLVRENSNLSPISTSSTPTGDLSNPSLLGPSQEFTRRFFNEENQGSLNGPLIARILSLEEKNKLGYPKEAYFIMSLPRGRTMKHYLGEELYDAMKKNCNSSMKFCGGSENMVLFCGKTKAEAEKTLRAFLRANPNSENVNEMRQVHF